jgi:hypothetical protein
MARAGLIVSARACLRVGVADESGKQEEDIQSQEDHEPCDGPGERFGRDGAEERA